MFINLKTPNGTTDIRKEIILSVAKQEGDRLNFTMFMNGTGPVKFTFTNQQERDFAYNKLVQDLNND